MSARRRREPAALPLAPSEGCESGLPGLARVPAGHGPWCFHVRRRLPMGPIAREGPAGDLQPATGGCRRPGIDVSPRDESPRHVWFVRLHVDEVLAE